MQVIDEVIWQFFLQSNPEDTHIHECALFNGTFLVDMQDGRLLALYKLK